MIISFQSSILKSLEKFPELNWYPVYIRSLIDLVTLVPTIMRHEFYRVSILTSREFGDDMFTTVCKLDSYIGITAIIFSMLQEAIFSTLVVGISGIDPRTGPISGTRCLYICKRYVLVGWLIHGIIGGSITGYGPQNFRVFQ